MVLAVAMPLSAMAQVDKITICHVAGQHGSETHVTVEVAAAAVYGLGGHFHEHGTPRTGHEGDYLGPCVEEENSTGEGNVETTTTGEEESTTTETDETPSEVNDSTLETIPAITDGGSTTPTSDLITETVTVDDAEDENEAPNQVADDEPEVAVAVGVENITGEDTVRAAVAGETLPFTGPPTQLALPAVLLLLAGAMVLFLAGGFGSTGSHVAVDRIRLGLGLQRGRHESSRC